MSGAPEKFQVFTFDLEPRGYCHGLKTTLDEARKFIKSLNCTDYEIRQGGVIVEACRGGSARKGQP